jgi:HSP20 family molecular chaperone IbpA
VDSDKIDAEFRDGILRLKIAKRASSQVAGRKIDVRKT